MKYLKVRIAVGTSDSTFDIYYNSVNSSTRALLYDTGLPAIGLTNEVLETGEGITVSVPDNATSIVLSSNPTAFCSEVNGSNNSTFSIPLGCMSYTVSSSAGIFNYFYTDCDCIGVSATLDATYGYTEQTFCALQDSVNSGYLTIVDNGSCFPSPTPTPTPTPAPTSSITFSPISSNSCSFTTSGGGGSSCLSGGTFTITNGSYNIQAYATINQGATPLTQNVTYLNIDNGAHILETTCTSQFISAYSSPVLFGPGTYDFDYTVIGSGGTNTGGSGGLWYTLVV